jgi:hypothetical protein
LTIGKHITQDLRAYLTNNLIGKSVKQMMAKMILKADLPVKTCIACMRPFTWRRKWKKNWENVKYCSNRCALNRNKKSNESQ